MMIAIACKNLAFLLSKHNSSLSSALSPHFFSTLRERQNVIYPKVYDLLFLKHHFPPELASQVASDLALSLKRPENADTILSFLKESGCSSTQMGKIVKFKPRILLRGVEDIKLKFKMFHDLGLSPEDTAKMMSNFPVILHLSAKGTLIPSLSVLKGLLGSDYDVARLLRKSAWPLYHNLANTMLPNIEFLKSIGVPMDRILFFLHLHPRSLSFKPNVMRKSVEKAKEIGIDESSKMFLYVTRIVASMSKGMWELKLQTFQEMGFSEIESLTMFKKFPSLFSTSTEKIEKIKQLLLATGKYDMLSIVNNPGIFACSIEQRIEPRLQILEILESKNLVKKWPCLSQCFMASNDKFLERYIRPYSNVVGEAFDTKCFVEDKQ